MSTYAYAGLRVALLNREDGTEKLVLLYPATRVELIEMPLEGPPTERVRTFVPLDNMTGDMMGWREAAPLGPPA